MNAQWYCVKIWKSPHMISIIFNKMILQVLSLNIISLRLWFKIVKRVSTTENCTELSRAYTVMYKCILGALKNNNY